MSTETGGSQPIAIAPIDFVPPPENAPRRRIQPWQALVGAVLLIAALFLLFLFSARSVRFDTNAEATAVTPESTLQLQVGSAWLLLPGTHRIQAAAEGYYDLEADIEVGPEQSQRFDLKLKPLPGIVELKSSAPGAELWVDGVLAGAANERLDVEAGPHAIAVRAPRYQDLEMEIEVVGRREYLAVEAELTPNWGNFTFVAEPEGGTVHLDGEPVGPTPGPLEILAGEHEVMIALEGYQPWRRTIRSRALEERIFEDIKLAPAVGQIELSSQPARASVTLNGLYQGHTPITISVPPGRSHRLEVVRSGYRPWRRSVSADSASVARMSARLEPETGEIKIAARPDSALLYVNGRLLGRATRNVDLPAVQHSLEIRAPGHVPWSRDVTPRPGFPQEIRVRLLTPEEARVAAISREITSPAGQRMILINPGPITMGASRREPGRRANEVLREVNLTQPYYLSEHEVTNAQFRRFRPDHKSGTHEEYELNEDDQPVVNVSWDLAADFCNWLSRRAGLTPVYGRSTASGRPVRANANGYRLPTEAEWAFAARHTADGLLKFPWGSARRPEDRQGNYADRSAINIVGRVVFGYTDGFPVSAPPGSFKANGFGLYDMGGNVAEWIHDYYEIPSDAPTQDPTGPVEGEFHSIRGSSWMHGSVTELRYSYRDYGSDGRVDLGFRVALPLDVPEFETGAREDEVMNDSIQVASRRTQ